MSKNKISSLVVVAIVALVLVPSALAKCKNNDGYIEIPSDKNEDAAAANAIDKVVSSIDQELPRMLLRYSDGGLRRNDGCSGSSCNVLNDPCCSGCSCIPVGILVGVCAGSCC